MESLKTLCASWCGPRVKLPFLGFTSSESRSCWSRRVRSIDWQVKIQGGQSHSYTSGRLRRLSWPPVISPCETVAQMWPQLLLLFSCPVGSNSFMPPWTAARQAPLSMEFSRQEYWSGLPFPSPGDLPNPGIVPTSLKSPALASRFFTVWATREACVAREPLAGGDNKTPLAWTPMALASQPHYSSRLCPETAKTILPNTSGQPGCQAHQPGGTHATVAQTRACCIIRTDGCLLTGSSPGNPASVLSLLPFSTPIPTPAFLQGSPYGLMEKK